MRRSKPTLSADPRLWRVIGTRGFTTSLVVRHGRRSLTVDVGAPYLENSQGTQTTEALDGGW